MFYKISKCVSRLNFTSAASWCVTLYEFFILVLHHSPQAFYIQLQICIVSIQGKVYWVNFYCISPIFCFYNLSSLELVQLYFPPFSLSCESFCHNLQWKVESPTTTQTFLNREKLLTQWWQFWWQWWQPNVACQDSWELMIAVSTTCQLDLDWIPRNHSFKVELSFQVKWCLFSRGDKKF